MAARATRQLNSAFGSFAPGDLLEGVPIGIQRSWIDVGIATGKPSRVEPEEATAGPPETAVTRKCRGKKPSGEEG